MVSLKNHVKTRRGASQKIVVSKNARIALIVARFNEEIAEALQKSCHAELVRQGISEKNIKIFFVPGAFELPWACQQLVDSKKWDAVIALGAVIRGETPHFDAVVLGATMGIMEVNLGSPAPVIFGVLTTNNLAQAQARVHGGRHGDKGIEFARTALNMVYYKDKLQ